MKKYIDELIKLLENLNQSSKNKINKFIEYLYLEKQKYKKIKKIQKRLNLVYLFNLKIAKIINEIKIVIKSDLEKNKIILKENRNNLINDIFKEQSNEDISKSNSIFNISEKIEKSENSKSNNFLEIESNFDLFKKTNTILENEITRFSQNYNLEEKDSYFSENKSGLNFDNNSIILNKIEKQQKKNNELVENLFIKNIDKNIKKLKHIKKKKKKIKKLKHIIDKNKKKITNTNKNKKIKKLKRGKYKIINIIKKQNAIDLTKYISIKETSQFLKISEKNIKRWLKNGIERKKGAGRKIRDPKMEKDLKDWMKNEFFRVGRFPDFYSVKKEARVFSNFKEFKASKGWCDKFFKRNFEFMQNVRNQRNF